MNLTASEKSTINFYEWEYKHRGYYHFNSPIDIEVPYIPFQHITYSDTPITDDGRAPSLFTSIKNVFSPLKEKEEPAPEIEELKPRFLAFDDKPKLIALVISFPKGTEILPKRNNEFLTMLTFSEHLFSFEIVGTSEDITFQIVCSEFDIGRVQSHLQAYFPTALIKKTEVSDFAFSVHNDVAIADFGLNDEYMRPLFTTDSFGIDPLTSVIGIMESLQDNDIAVFQILFKGITSPLAKDISYAVSDGAGGSFFADAPEMTLCAKTKIANPLFSVVMRIATQGKNDYRSQYLAQELSKSISTISSSEYNKLIPLSNEGYDYDFHYYNLNNRLSNRLGFILNSQELNTFLHYPNKSIISKKLGLGESKTKKQKDTLQKGIYLGENIHQGENYPVHLDAETRLSHVHILGATGVGKSTLIANMMLEDVNQGRGCALFDPHGDICDDILQRIPEKRKDDVIIIDPSDGEFPIGFNLLEAKTEAEKIVLSSDLVSAFKRHATAWGDNMTAVLQNAVNTILESTRGGTLIELKRFLIEEEFRNSYLASVDDPSPHYYWKNEYPMVRKGIAPLLTRIDTFLRPKLVRYMLVQKKGVDISDCLKHNKIVLLKLSQGLIGEQNSYLLGSLFLAKFNQSALARQNQSKEKRSPYMLYLDEFQNFITPSIERILSGARKYALGITLVHQELGQIQDTSLLNSLLSNPKTRICFRLGDSDAKRLETGFSYFEQSDLQSLNRGEAVMRIGSSTNDFNIATKPLTEIQTDYSHDIINRVREKYGTPKKEIEELLISLLPTINTKKTKRPQKEITVLPVEKLPTIIELQQTKEVREENTPTTHFEQQKETYLKEVEEQEQERVHRSIQNYIRTLGQQRGFVSHLETETKDGGRIDVTLLKDDIRIAVEVSVTNTIDYEVQNIQKCLKENYTKVYIVSESKIHLSNIRKRTKETLNSVDYKKVKFGSPAQFLTYLNTFEKKPKEQIKRVRGYRVKTHQSETTDGNTESRHSKIQNIILKAVKKKPKKS